MYFDQLCADFSALPEVEALALGGSRAGEHYDEKSDYDLYVYCSRLPEEDVRRRILDRACRYMEIGNAFWETEDDCTLKDGTDIDILYRDLDNFSLSIKSVVEEHRAGNGYTTCLWHNLLHSKIIYDRNGTFANLQKQSQVPYPSGLRENIIARNMRLLTGNLPSYDAQIKKAFSRGDIVSVNHRTAAFLESYFDVIFALNGLTHPGEKRMLQYAKEHARILPADFEKNVTDMLENLFKDSDAAMESIRKIISALEEVVNAEQN